MRDIKNIKDVTLLYQDAEKIVTICNGAKILDTFLKKSDKLKDDVINKMKDYIKELSDDKYYELCREIELKHKKSLEWFYEGEFLELIKEDACIAALFEYLQKEEVKING